MDRSNGKSDGSRLRKNEKKKKTIKKSGNKIKIKILQKRSVLFTALWNNKRKKINLFII